MGLNKQKEHKISDSMKNNSNMFQIKKEQKNKNIINMIEASN